MRLPRYVVRPLVVLSATAVIAGPLTWSAPVSAATSSVPTAEQLIAPDDHLFSDLLYSTLTPLVGAELLSLVDGLLGSGDVETVRPQVEELAAAGLFEELTSVLEPLVTTLLSEGLVPEVLGIAEDLLGSGLTEQVAESAAPVTGLLLALAGVLLATVAVRRRGPGSDAAGP